MLHELLKPPRASSSVTRRCSTPFGIKGNFTAFQQALEISEQAPERVVTDGLASYPRAIAHSRGRVLKGWLLDTNIISELRKRQCHPAVKAWSETQQPQSFYLSVVTIAEIRFGIEHTSKLKLKQDLAQWLDEELRPWFSDRLLPIDENAILTWRKQVELGRKQGYTFSQPDLFIAAIAANHNLCVVTRNVKDFQKAGVAVFNPFLLQKDKD